MQAPTFLYVVLVVFVGLLRSAECFALQCPESPSPTLLTSLLWLRRHCSTFRLINYHAHPGVSVSSLAASANDEGSVDQSDYERFIDRTLSTGMKPPDALRRGCGFATLAPFCHSIIPLSDHLVLSAVPPNNLALPPHSPSASMLQCEYPLATDAKLRQSVASMPVPDLNLGATFRLSKFYEAVDALTADVAYRHVGGMGNGIAMVTAHHCHSRKLHRPDLETDLVLRCYLVGAKKSSVELRTDALQPDRRTGAEVLVNVCHTTMVAVDNKTLRPKGDAVPPLDIDPWDEDEQVQRQVLTELHRQIRKRRQRDSMQLRRPASKPPTFSELEYLHELFSKLAVEKDRPSPTRPATPPYIKDYTFSNHIFVYPEKSNVHGKLFGGFVMEQAHNLAMYAASFFAGRHAIVPLGMDDATFLQPIAIGDLLTFTARVVHSTRRTCRVLCHVEVRDPTDPGRSPMRSNRLMFTFVADHMPGIVVPETYAESLMHLDALRWHREEGPTDEEAGRIIGGRIDAVNFL